MSPADIEALRALRRCLRDTHHEGLASSDFDDAWSSAGDMPSSVDDAALAVATAFNDLARAREAALAAVDAALDAALDATLPQDSAAEGGK